MLRRFLSYCFQQMHHKSFQTQTTCRFASYNLKKCNIHSRRKQICGQTRQVPPTWVNSNMQLPQPSCALLRDTSHHARRPALTIICTTRPSTNSSFARTQTLWNITDMSCARRTPVMHPYDSNLPCLIQVVGIGAELLLLAAQRPPRLQLPHFRRIPNLEGRRQSAAPKLGVSKDLGAASESGIV